MTTTDNAAPITPPTAEEYMEMAKRTVGLIPREAARFNIGISLEDAVKRVIEWFVFDNPLLFDRTRPEVMHTDRKVDPLALSAAQFVWLAYRASPRAVLPSDWIEEAREQLLADD